MLGVPVELIIWKPALQGTRIFEDAYWNQHCYGSDVGMEEVRRGAEGRSRPRPGTPGRQNGAPNPRCGTAAVCWCCPMLCGCSAR